jgi:hypothetical protein
MIEVVEPEEEEEEEDILTTSATYRMKQSPAFEIYVAQTDIL